MIDGSFLRDVNCGRSSSVEWRSFLASERRVSIPIAHAPFGSGFDKSGVLFVWVILTNIAVGSVMGVSDLCAVVARVAEAQCDDLIRAPPAAGNVRTYSVRTIVLTRLGVAVGFGGVFCLRHSGWEVYSQPLLNGRIGHLRRRYREATYDVCVVCAPMVLMIRMLGRGDVVEGTYVDETREALVVWAEESMPRLINYLVEHLAWVDDAWSAEEPVELFGLRVDRTIFTHRSDRLPCDRAQSKSHG